MLRIDVSVFSILMHKVKLLVLLGQFCKYCISFQKPRVTTHDVFSKTAQQAMPLRQVWFIK